MNEIPDLPVDPPDESHDAEREVWHLEWERDLEALTCEPEEA